MTEKKKAWRVTVVGLHGVVFADSASVARITAALSAHKAGYPDVFKGLKCKRARDLDGVPPRWHKGVYTESAVLAHRRIKDWVMVPVEEVGG